MFKIKIKYYDKNIILINKPIGILVIDFLKLNFLNLNKNLPNFGILNRLDKYTTGLILIAKNFFFYFYFKKLILKKLIKKNYICFIKKKNNIGFINVDIIKKKKNYIIKNNKKSITFYKTIKKAKNFFLNNICIKTGRTHQIRIHLFHIKNNLFNDNYYYNKIKIFNNTLHFNKIMFYYPIFKKKVNFICNLYSETKKIFLFNFLK